MAAPSHQDLYMQAELYDIAFSFKEYAAECDFMLAQFQKINSRAATSWLEMAAGPARHSLEMARRGLRAHALDLSPAMVSYGDNLAATAILPIDYRQGDMRDFQLKERVDLAGLMIDSICYLLDEDSLNRHLRCVSEALSDDGLYVIEMAHPKDHFNKEGTTKTDWTIERDGKTVHTSWGDESDPFDAVSQTVDVTVRISSEIDGEKVEFVDQAKQRCYTCTEFQALIKANGCFEIVEQFGAMDPSIDLGHNEAWRMISILRKTG